MLVKIILWVVVAVIVVVVFIAFCMAYTLSTELGGGTSDAAVSAPTACH